MEKLEQQKVKELERETEAARQAEYTNLSSWRDELDEEEKETSGDKQIKRIRGLSPPLHHRQPNYRTHRVSFCACIAVFIPSRHFYNLFTLTFCRMTMKMMRLAMGLGEAGSLLSVWYRHQLHQMMMMRNTFTW